MPPKIISPFLCLGNPPSYIKQKFLLWKPKKKKSPIWISSDFLIKEIKVLSTGPCILIQVWTLKLHLWNRWGIHSCKGGVLLAVNSVLMVLESGSSEYIHENHSVTWFQACFGFIVSNTRSLVFLELSNMILSFPFSS